MLDRVLSKRGLPVEECAFLAVRSGSWPTSAPEGGGGGDSHMKQTGMLIVSFRGVNFGFGLA